MTTDIIVERLARAIESATLDIDEHGRRIAVSLWNLLADGSAATSADIAAHSGVDESVVDERLATWPGIFRDEEGRIVGFWGLAIPEMAHSFHAAGGMPIYAWCALDPLLIVPVIGRRAHVKSKDPLTGEGIELTVTPDEILEVSPVSTVVTFLIPDKPFDRDVIQTFCNYVHYFASHDSAERWASGRNGIAILPMHEAFEVGKSAWRRFRQPVQER